MCIEGVLSLTHRAMILINAESTNDKKFKLNTKIQFSSKQIMGCIVWEQRDRYKQHGVIPNILEI